VNALIPFDEQRMLLEDNQLTKELTESVVSLVLFSHSSSSASLGSITKTLNYNWDFTYTNDFLSQLETPTWAD
jgi:hypothetical protein